MSENSLRQENYRSFMDRMELHFPDNSTHASIFYKLVKYEFRSHVRRELDENGKPVRYFEHQRAVALILLDEIGLFEFSIVMAALGHDVWEDTRMPLHEIYLICGSRTAHIIGICSKRPKEGFLPRLLAHGDWQCWAVKIADRIHNLRTMGTDEVFIQKTLIETREWYFTIADLACETAGVYAPQMQKLRQLLIETYNEVSK